MQCPSTFTIDSLTFESCIFPNNSLNPNWLHTNLPIEKLSLLNSGLTFISKGAFASNIFSNTKTLEICRAKIHTFNKFTFQELPILNNLYISDNIIQEADFDLLSPISSSIEVLMLDSSLKNLQVLLNITSGPSILTKIQIISLQDNTLPTLTPQIFKSIPNIHSLYLARSNIETISSDTFKFTKSLQQLDLKNNLLSQLPPEIFSSILSRNPEFKATLSENPWNCTCDFQWIQKAIQKYPQFLTEIPQCEKPEKNFQLHFTNAKFCDDNEKNITTTEVTERPSRFVKFTCSTEQVSRNQETKIRKLLSSDIWEFPRSEDFSVQPLDDGTVVINITFSGSSLMWYKSDEISSDSINCLRDVKGPLILRNLQEASSYTICLLEDFGQKPSPFNCLTVRTGTFSSSLKTNAWLTNDDKTMVFSITTSLLVIIMLISILMSFLIIRRNPSLLRGSKRILMVRKRSVKALVLPQGVKIDSPESPESNLKYPTCSSVPSAPNIPDPGYLTPLEVRKCRNNRYTRGISLDCPRQLGRKDSKTSGVSSQYSAAPSYISGIEPSAIELANWRRCHNGKIQRSFSSCLEDDECQESSPPPLPPHPLVRTIIPSVSLTIDNCEENREHNFCIDSHEMYLTCAN